MPINIFDRQFFGDLTQFDTAQAVSVTINEPSYSISDALADVAGLKRTIDEGAGGFTKTGFTSSGFVHSEAIFFEDTVTRARDVPVGLTENYSISDGITRVLGLRRVITTFKQIFDDIFFGDSNQFDIQSGGSIFISDAIADVADLKRTIIESKGFTTDGFTPSGFTTEGGVQFFDEVERNNQVFAPISESYSISDAISRKIELIRAMTESYSVSDVISRKIDLLRTMTESYSISDNLIDVANLFRSIGENYSISDVVADVADHFRSMTENYSISDTLVDIASLFRSVSENYSVSDAISRRIDLFRTMTENYSISDIISRRIDLGRAMSETVSIVDAIGRAVFTRPKLFFVSRIKESLSYSSRIKEVEDVSI